MDKKIITISEAAKMIGVTIETLRRWDTEGTLRAIRFKPGGNRYYDLNAVLVFLNDLFVVAREWVSSQSPKESENYHCADSSIFQARLVKLEQGLHAMPGMENDYSLITSIVGEIGNNSFDHNLGLWPDVRGILFAYDLNKRQIAIADRGQGILATLRRVKTGLANDADALLTAFTEKISGRAPESRGNGLKFVRKVVAQSIRSAEINLYFQSGEAALNLKKGDTGLAIIKADASFRGCMALINF